jgi:hypothetical protein
MIMAIYNYFHLIHLHQDVVDAVLYFILMLFIDIHFILNFLFIFMVFLTMNVAFFMVIFK